jgi:hypothetical protein
MFSTLRIQPIPAIAQGPITSGVLPAHVLQYRDGISARSILSLWRRSSSQIFVHSRPEIHAAPGSDDDIIIYMPPPRRGRRPT